MVCSSSLPTPSYTSASPTELPPPDTSFTPISSPASRLAFLLNPRGGNGRAYQSWTSAWPSILPRLAASTPDIAADVFTSTHPGHLEELARACAAAGYDVIVAVGGDGSIHEVINGLLPADPQIVASTIASRVSPLLAIVPCGTGSDFVRSLPWGKDPSSSSSPSSPRPSTSTGSRATVPRPTTTTHSPLPSTPETEEIITAVDRILSSERTETTMDVGYAYAYGEGGRRGRYFINMASCGFSSHAARLANSLFKPLGRWGLAYDVAGAVALVTQRPVPVRVSWTTTAASTTSDCRRESWNVPFPTVIAMGNGQYFGGGMRMAPKADVSNGSLSLVMLTGYRVWDFVRLLGKIKDGSWVDIANKVRPGVAEARMVDVDRVEVVPLRPQAAQSLWLECEGEVLGHAPFQVVAIPQAIRLIL